MSSDDDAFDYDDEEDGNDLLAEGEGAPEDSGSGCRSVRDWMNGKRGWIVIGALAVIQAVFAIIMIALRSDASPVEEIRARQVQDLAVAMLGHEVSIKQVYQLVRTSGGKRMTIGLDITLVLGQLPEERIEGAPRPTPEEFEVFIFAIKEMEQGVRSEVNMLLQKIPVSDYGNAAVYEIIKDDIRNYINNSLERLDFGKSIRPGIGKRRVTEVLLPMFVRQMY